MIVLIVNSSDLNAITAQSKFQNKVSFIGKFQIKFQILTYVHLTQVHSNKHLNNLINSIFTKEFDLMFMVSPVPKM